MITFLTTEDFTYPPYDLPPLKPKESSFNAFCVAEQEVIFRRLLGTLLYDQFEAGLDALPATYSAVTDYPVDAEVMNSLRTKKYKSLQTPNLNQPITDPAYWEPVADVWLDLAYGANYTIDDISTYKWVGMKQLIRPYVYYRWLLDREDTVTNVGAVKQKAENAERVSNTRKCVKADIVFRRLVGDYCYYSYRRSINHVNTFYGYMKSEPVSFVDWDFTYPSRLNALGI
jgi:hypothetical protein